MRLAAAVRSKLRGVDRSNRRLDMMSSIFNQHIGRKKNHACCPTCFEGESEYPLLFEMRNRLFDSKEEEPYFSTVEKISTSDDEEDDDYNDFLNDFVSVEDERRKEELEQQLQRRKDLKSKGYGFHIPDTIDHITSCLVSDTIMQRESNTGDSMVVHMCDEDSPYSARLDLQLEILAERYIGTRFRRLSIRDGESLRWAANWMSSVVGEPVVAGSLLCFSGNNLVGWTNECFLDDSTMRHQDLLRFLDNLHVLSDSVPIIPATAHSDGMGDGYSDNDADSSENQPSSFCGDPRCMKSFPHEHIGKGVGSSTGPSYLLCGPSSGDREGDEAFSKNFFTKI